MHDVPATRIHGVEHERDSPGSRAEPVGSHFDRSIDRPSDVGTPRRLVVARFYSSAVRVDLEHRFHLFVRPDAPTNRTAAHRFTAESIAQPKVTPLLQISSVFF